jgi:hypothetical protein
VSIGTAPGLADISPWTSVGSKTTVVVNGLNLTDGSKYFTNARINSALGTVFGSASTNSWTVRTNSVFATRVAYATANTSGNGPRSVLIADVNGDNHPDLLTVGNSNQLSVFLGAGDGTFGVRSDSPISGSGQGISVADLNHDSKLDVFVTCFSNSDAYFAGNGNGTFAARVDLVHNHQETSGVAVDLNEDGFSDLVSTSYDEQAVVVRLNQFGTPGTFGPRVLTALTSDTASNPVTPKDLKVADVNHDGHLDLILTNESNTGNYAGKIAVLLGRGDGTFLSPIWIPIASGNSLKQLVVGDFDGDSVPDLAVANYGANSIGVFHGNGDGTFIQVGTLPSGTGPFGLVTADLNGDGILDLVATNASSNSLSLYVGNGDGTFANQSTYATGSFPQRLAIGDLDGDGKPDIAVAERAADSVGVLMMRETP